MGTLTCALTRPQTRTVALTDMRQLMGWSGPLGSLRSMPVSYLFATRSEVNGQVQKCSSKTCVFITVFESHDEGVGILPPAIGMKALDSDSNSNEHSWRWSAFLYGDATWDGAMDVMDVDVTLDAACGRGGCGRTLDGAMDVRNGCGRDVMAAWRTYAMDCKKWREYCLRGPRRSLLIQNHPRTLALIYMSTCMVTIPSQGPLIYILHGHQDHPRTLAMIYVPVSWVAFRVTSFMR
jgi:hypothetical protein